MTVEGISLPMTDAVSAFHRGGAMLDAHPRRELAAALVAGGVALAIGFLATQVTPQQATGGLVGIDEAVDGFMADRQTVLPGGAFTDLLGTGVAAHPRVPECNSLFHLLFVL
jgi:hypothetical protein